jgi:hypothetical protein
MIHHITVKGEGCLAVRTYPNIVQILRVHLSLPCCKATTN